MGPSNVGDTDSDMASKYDTDSGCSHYGNQKPINSALSGLEIKINFNIL